MGRGNLRGDTIAVSHGDWPRGIVEAHNCRCQIRPARNVAHPRTGYSTAVLPARVHGDSTPEAKWFGTTNAEARVRSSRLARLLICALVWRILSNNPVKQPLAAKIDGLASPSCRHKKAKRSAATAKRDPSKPSPPQEKKDGLEIKVLPSTSCVTSHTDRAIILRSTSRY